jgi:spoIIIJ-associated protein
MPDKKYANETAEAQIESFLEETLDNMDLDVEFEIEDAPEDRHTDFETPELVVNFSGPDTELLLENKAEVLLALEHLTMEMLRVPPEDHSLICFDANDWRRMRIEELRMQAVDAAERVKKSGMPFLFNPMNSRERRIVHLALRDEKELRSESLGVGSERRVVVLTAEAPLPPAPPPGPRTGGPRGYSAQATPGWRPPVEDRDGDRGRGRFGGGRGGDRDRRGGGGGGRGGDRGGRGGGGGGRGPRR